MSLLAASHLRKVVLGDDPLLAGVQVHEVVLEQNSIRLDGFPDEVEGGVELRLRLQLLLRGLPLDGGLFLGLRRAKRVAMEGSFVMLETTQKFAAAMPRTALSAMYVVFQYTRLLSSSFCSSH